MNNSDQGPHYNEVEIREYNPEGYRAFQNLKIFGYTVVAVGMIAVPLVGFGTGGPGAAIPIMIVIIGIGAVVAFLMKLEQDKATENRIRKEKETAAQIQESLSLQRRATQMISKIDAEKMGDYIIAGAGATVITRSTLINSMNTVEKTSPEIAAALKIIGGYVEQTKDPEAGKTFNRLTERIASGESGDVVQSIWERLLKLVPQLVSLGDVVVKVAGFIQGLA